MSNVAYIILTTLQLIFAYGIQLLNHFTNKKLGMNRWVVYHNMQINKFGFIGAIRHLITIVTTASTFLLIKTCYKKIVQSKVFIFDIVVLVLINFVLLVEILLFNTISQKLNYFYIVILLLVFILQVTKILLRNKR